MERQFHALGFITYPHALNVCFKLPCPFINLFAISSLKIPKEKISYLLSPWEKQ